MELKGEEYNFALKMVQLHSVHVHFPGSVTLSEDRKFPVAHGTRVDFKHWDNLVEAHLETGPWTGAQLRPEFIHPVIDTVSKQIGTIDDLLPTLIDLSRKKNAPDTLMYSIDYDGMYRVYDCSSTPPGKVMDILFAMKGTDERLLNPEYKRFLPMAQNVNQDERHIVHVAGRSLKEAVGLAVNIYTFADELRAIKEGRSLVKN